LQAFMTNSNKNLVDEVREEIIAERVRQLEDAVLSLSADIQNLSNAMREMQRFIVKMATNQSQMAERVQMWPYVKVETKAKKRTKGPGPIDE
jgi:hypothetical protein